MAGQVANFGIPRIEMSRETQTGTMPGTPADMSPEQFMDQVADAHTDIYTAGVALYQLLTGERQTDGLRQRSITSSGAQFLSE